jgi:hypothetical protein
MPNERVTASQAFRATPHMTSKKRCRLAQCDAKPTLELIPAPQSAQDVVAFLRFAACLGLADSELVGHLEEMSALFPDQLLGAYKAFRERQACDN